MSGIIPLQDMHGIKEVLDAIEREVVQLEDKEKAQLLTREMDHEEYLRRFNRMLAFREAVAALRAKRRMYQV